MVARLGSFVLVARLGSVSAAARALDVSESAVSQALTALRTHFGDPLIRRAGGGGMRPTPAGARLLPVASRMVALSADTEDAVRAARGAPDELCVIATSTPAEFVLPSLVEAFACRSGTRERDLVRGGLRQRDTRTEWRTRTCSGSPFTSHPGSVNRPPTAAISRA
jgi:DNA-binding transcriptional LysR family regulator